MGNTQSAIFERISQILPNIGSHQQYDANGKKTGKEYKLFNDFQDRGQFIHAVMSVMSDNGRLNLGQHNFRLLYSRKANGKLRASLVAVKDGVIEAKIEPTEDGEYQADAFKALRAHVERRLDEVLQSVPEASGSNTIESSRNIATQASSSEAPPSYDSSYLGIGARGKKS